MTTPSRKRKVDSPGAGAAANGRLDEENDLEYHKRLAVEKILISAAYNYIVAARKEQGSLPLSGDTCDIVAQLLNISPTAARRVHEEDVQSHGVFKDPAHGGGRKAKLDRKRFETDVHAFVTKTYNDGGVPTVAKVRVHLCSKWHINVSDSTVLRAMHAVNANSVANPPTHHPLHDGEKIVLYRAHYLERLDKLRQTGTPLVCLDESYAYVNMKPHRYWVFKGDTVPRKPKGERVNMVAAIVYPKWGKRVGSSKGQWVPGSFVRWLAGRATQPQGVGAGGAGAAANSPLSADSATYSGNMDAVQFERWFTQLSATLREKYGRCTIKLDNARYHKRPVQELPTGAWNKSRLVDFITANGKAADLTMRKVQLYELAKSLVTDERHLKCVTIAKGDGHEVIHTPPYHCELQEIEKIWGALKSKLRAEPAAKPAQLLAQIDAGVTALSAESFVGAWESVEKWEKYYKKCAEEGVGLGVDDDVSDDDESLYSEEEEE